MTAAYGELRNNSQEIMLVTAYDSNSFAHVSMHQSSMEDGVSRMREIKTVQIAAGESLLLEPGGLHLMLMQPKAGLQVGDRVEIGVDVTGQRFVFSLPVESR